MKNPHPMIHVRLPKEIVKRVDLLSVYTDSDRARTMEQLLELAFDCLEHHPQKQGQPDLAKVVALAVTA